MFNKEYFTEELLQSFEGAMLTRKDENALKEDIEKYLKSLPLSDLSITVIDELLIGFFGYCDSNPSLDIVMSAARLTGNLNIALHYFKHASVIGYRKEESDMMYNAFLGIIEIIVAHNVNPDRTIGNKGFTVL